MANYEIALTDDRCRALLMAATKCMLRHTVGARTAVAFVINKGDYDHFTKVIQPHGTDMIQSFRIRGAYLIPSPHVPEGEVWAALKDEETK